jgi:hypothetical protein
LIAGIGAALARRRRTIYILGAMGIGLALIPDGVVACFLLYEHDCDDAHEKDAFHSDKIVPQKYLTNNSYWGTVIDMANVLNTDKQIAVIRALTQ